MSAQIIPFRNTHRKLFVDWMTFGNHYGPNGTEEEIRASWAKFYNQNEAAWRSQYTEADLRTQIEERKRRLRALLDS